MERAVQPQGRLPRAAKRHVQGLLLRMQAAGELKPGDARVLEQLPYPFERKS